MARGVSAPTWTFFTEAVDISFYKLACLYGYKKLDDILKLYGLTKKEARDNIDYIIEEMYDILLDNFIDDLKHYLKKRFPSLEDTEEWIGRGNKVILRNDYIGIGISAYGDIMNIWAIPIDYYNEYSDEYYNEDKIPKKAYQQAERIHKWIIKNVSDISYKGTFSNGEQVFKSRGCKGVLCVKDKECLKRLSGTLTTKEDLREMEL